MNWKLIRLELAATPDFPKGSVGRGFLIRAPIDDDGKIDEEALRKSPGRAKVRRVWPNEPDEGGQLLRVDRHWALRCEGKPDQLIDLGANMRSGTVLLVKSGTNHSPFTVRLFD